MRSASWVITGACLIAATASADVKRLPDRMWHLGTMDRDLSKERPPRFAFTHEDVHVAPRRFDVARPEPDELGWWTERVVMGVAGDGKAAWIAADAGIAEPACGAAPCGPEPAKVTEKHMTVLFEQVGSKWEWVAWHVADVVTGKEQAEALKQGRKPPPFPRGVGAGAEAVVKLFETTMADPKLLAASVSARKDVVLYGSEGRERTVGGAKVKAKLAAWKLAFKVRDGVQAGVTASKTVAWVAANVDATSAKKPGKATPYRVLVVYEQVGTAWQLVQAHFSFVP